MLVAFTIKRRLNQMIGQLSHHASPSIVFRPEYWSNIEHNNDIYKSHLKCHSLDSGSLGIDLLHNLVGNLPSKTSFGDHLQGSPGDENDNDKYKVFQRGMYAPPRWPIASHIPGFKNPTYATYIF